MITVQICRNCSLTKRGEDSRGEVRRGEAEDRRGEER